MNKKELTVFLRSYGHTYYKTIRSFLINSISAEAKERLLDKEDNKAIQWIEQQLKDAGVDELEKLIFDITDDLDNATIFEDATRAYGLKYARTTAQNRIKELKDEHRSIKKS